MSAGEQPLSEKEHSKADDGVGEGGDASGRGTSAEGGGSEETRIEGCCSLCSSLIDEELVLCKVVTRWPYQVDDKFKCQKLKILNSENEIV